MSKRYWLFIYSDYYPLGGMHDFFESYDTIDQCKETVKNSVDVYKNYHVFDSQTNKIKNKFKEE